MNERPLRADAQRNINELLKAAKEVFATTGVDAPVRKIAEAAGVGMGTVYRHFPERSGLVAAVFREQVDACADAAKSLATQHEPSEALAIWMLRYADFIVAKRGLAKALHSGNPAFESLPNYFMQQLRPALQMLLDNAVNAHDIRPNVEPDDLLHAVASLCAPSENEGRSKRMIGLLLDGLRYDSKA